LLGHLKFFIIVNESHIITVLLSFFIIQRCELGFKIEWSLDLLWQLDLGDDDVFEAETFVLEHFVQELFHASSVCGTLDLVDFQMSLASNENSNSFGDGSFKLLIKLIDTDLIAEVLYGFDCLLLVIRAPPNAENNSNVEGDENVIVCWAGSDWESVDHILFSYQELDLGVRQTPFKTTFIFDMTELTVGGNDSECSLGSKNRHDKQNLKIETYT
jgi:hypothetical protein